MGNQRYVAELKFTQNSRWTSLKVKFECNSAYHEKVHKLMNIQEKVISVIYFTFIITKILIIVNNNKQRSDCCTHSSKSLKEGGASPKKGARRIVFYRVQGNAF